MKMEKIKLSIVAAALLMSVVPLQGSVANAQRFNPRAVSPRAFKYDNKVQITIAAKGKALCEVVVPGNRTTAFAGQELAAYLKQIIGSEVKVVRRASGKLPAFILGEPGAKLAEVDLSKLDRDGYIIKTIGSNIIIAGNDDRRGYPVKTAGFHERGTLNGVYEFLERFAGVRFYFPGEIGTIVPRKAEWVLPGIDIIDRPDNQHRATYCVGLKQLGNGKLNFYDDKIAPDVQRLSALQRRNSTLNLPNCHGRRRCDNETGRQCGKSHHLYHFHQSGCSHCHTAACAHCASAGRHHLSARLSANYPQSLPVAYLPIAGGVDCEILSAQNT